MLDGSKVHYGEVLKATWSGELSDKCTIVVFYVFYNSGILHINVTLNWTVRLIIFKTSYVRCSFKILKVKFLKTGPLLVGMMRLLTGIHERKERLAYKCVELVII